MIILGAGASRAAGYPLAQHLIGAIEKEAQQSCFVNLRTAWKEWLAYRNGVEGFLKLLVYSSNPEVVLSVPDLFEIAIETEDAHQFEIAKAQFEQSPDEPLKNYENYFESAHRSQLQEAVFARRRFRSAPTGILPIDMPRMRRQRNHAIISVSYSLV